MSAPSSTPVHVFVIDAEKRRFKHNHQQFQHVVNRMLDYLEFPDKAARGVVGILGGLNGREVLRLPSSFPALIAHKIMARQLGFKGKEDNADVFMGRFLDAIKDAEQKAGRKAIEIQRADGETTIMTTYLADYIGEAALWALVEAQKSDVWKSNPAAAVTDALIAEACEKLPVAPPKKTTEMDERERQRQAAATIKGVFTKAETLVEGNIKRIVEEGGSPVREVRRFADRLIALAIKAEAARRHQERREREAEDEQADASMIYAGEEGEAP